MSDVGAFVMPFGRYQGRALANVPRPYLQWVLANVESLYDETRQAINAFLETAPTPAGDRTPRKPRRSKAPAAGTCGRCGLPGTTTRPLVHRECATDELPF